MLSKQLQKTTADQWTIVVKNVDAATLTTGLGVILQATTSCDGISAVKSPATTPGYTFIGISQKDIPVNGYGTVVCWGVADSILISNVGTSITVTKGDLLWPSAVAGQFFSTTPAGVVNAALSTYTAANLYAAVKPVIIATSSITVSAAAYVSGFVRAV